MKVAYSCPTDFVLTVVGTGAAVVSSPESRLFNGRPGDPTRIQLPSDWSGSTDDVVRLQFSRATAFNPGLVGLIGFRAVDVDSSAGLKISIAGRRVADSGFTYDLGGNCALVRTAEIEYDGSIKALGACDDGLDDIVAFEIALWNDQNGAPALAASGYVDVGVPWASPTMEIDIEEDWEFQDTDADVPTSENNQPWAAPYPPGRVLPVQRKLIDVAEAFQSGSVPGYQRLRRLLGNGKVSIQIPRWRDSDTGDLDVNLLHQTAIFCTTKFSRLPHDGADFYSAAWTATEVPALDAD